MKGLLQYAYQANLAVDPPAKRFIQQSRLLKPDCSRNRVFCWSSTASLSLYRGVRFGALCFLPKAAPDLRWPGCEVPPPFPSMRHMTNPAEDGWCIHLIAHRFGQIQYACTHPYVYFGFHYIQLGVYSMASATYPTEHLCSATSGAKSLAVSWMMPASVMGIGCIELKGYVYQQTRVFGMLLLCFIAGKLGEGMSEICCRIGEVLSPYSVPYTTHAAKQGIHHIALSAGSYTRTHDIFGKARCILWHSHHAGR